MQNYKNVIHLIFLFFCVTDDKSHSSAADSSVGAGEGAGIVQGLLQQVHHLPEGQNAEREFIAKRLFAPRTRRGTLERRQQRQQPLAGSSLFFVFCFVYEKKKRVYYIFFL